MLKRRVADMGCLGLPWAALGFVGGGRVHGGPFNTSDAAEEREGLVPAGPQFSNKKIL